MKKLIFFGCLVLFFSTIVFAQEKIEAPVWKVGDKWTFTASPTVVVVKADDSSYTVKFLTRTAEDVYIYDKSSLNRLYSIEGDRRKPYKGVGKRTLNFPSNIGTTWKDTYTTGVHRGTQRFPTGQEYSYIETHTVLGWEDVQVRAGKFKALKMEVKYERLEEIPNVVKGGTAWLWYSPDVKYLIKCQHETRFWVGYDDWELSSFKLKK